MLGAGGAGVGSGSSTSATAAEVIMIEPVSGDSTTSIRKVSPTAELVETRSATSAETVGADGSPCAGVAEPMLIPKATVITATAAALFLNPTIVGVISVFCCTVELLPAWVFPALLLVHRLVRRHKAFIQLEIKCPLFKGELIYFTVSQTGNATFRPYTRG